MKILAVTEFPAASVNGSHRAALRSIGIDYRIATRTAYMRCEVDWCLDVGYIDGMKEFAEAADLIQFHPAIGQPWSYQDMTPRYEPVERLPFGNITRWPDVPRIYYFHGSRNAAANIEKYREYYSGRGDIWASTVDYAYKMQAYYAPPCFDYSQYQRAPLRTDDCPLVVCHTPTDPGNCHTDVFKAAFYNKSDVIPVFGTGKPHIHTMAMKARCHAGFDHLRGGYSVNTLENCALGLVPLCAMPKELVELAEYYGGRPLPSIWQQQIDRDTIADIVRTLAADPGLTRRYQQEAYDWQRHVFDPKRVAELLAAEYAECCSTKELD